MTPQAIDRPSRPRPERRRGRQAAAPETLVEVLVCGSAEHGDEGAGIRALDHLVNGVPADVAVRVVALLDIDDLLAVTDGAGVVIVDTAVGIHPGQVLELPLEGLIARTDGLHPRSSHALEFPEVIGLAGLIRGHPLHGRVVVIGGSSFNHAGSLSGPVVAGLPALGTAIGTAIEHARDAGRPA
jgi:hydrogenase maturation protease